MKTIHQWFSEYGESHQNPTNKLIHWICVPSIFFSIIGLLCSVPVVFLSGAFPPVLAPYINLATIVLCIGLLFYLRLSFSLFIGMLLFSIFTLFGNLYLERLNIAPLWLISIGIFTIAWIGQFYGHKIEGKKPSFLKDIQFLLIGPAWLMGFVYQKLGIKY